MPLIQTKGAASAQGFGEFASTAANYIEDVFQTWLYTGNSSGASTQTITNGVDLAGKGGLVFAKGRSAAGSYPYWIDSARGVANELVSNFTAAQTSQGLISSFNSNGFTLGTNNGATNLNRSGDTYVSWTFRKQPKFFDVVTYTGASPSSVTVNHNLGSVPGCIIIKCTNDAASWAVYHRSTGLGQILYLDGTQAASSDTTFITAVNATSFTVGDNAFTNNSPTKTYVAYLFAHDAGGFGASGTDNVISCGSYVGNGSTTGPIITLGYEPQWVMIKAASSTSQWHMYDTMRGWTDGSIDSILYANLSNAEDNTNSNLIRPLATGFQLTANYTANTNGVTYIYIAIRRGPMRTPTTGTSVFLPNATTNDNTPFDYGFPIDALWEARQSGSANNTTTATRLSGNSSSLITSSTAAAGIFFSSLFGGGNQNSYQAGLYGSGIAAIQWAFRRAPGFFDVVCYTADNTYAVINHNLGVVPQLVIQKRRDGTSNWFVTTGAQVGYLELTDAFFNFSRTFTSTTFQPATTGPGYTYVAYLFATVAGVSKVGSYTGTGTTLQVNCGFTGGARFVLIKRTDSTGDWYVWDSARGIVAGNDPYLLLNSTAAEVTGTDYVDTFSSGFEISSTAPAAINANGGTFIFLAVA